MISQGGYDRKTQCSQVTRKTEVRQPTEPTHIRQCSTRSCLVAWELWMKTITDAAEKATAEVSATKDVEVRI